MVPTEDFKSGSAASMSVSDALAESQRLYEQIVRGTKLSCNQALDMIGSVAFKVLTEKAAIEAENLGTMVTEKLPVEDRETFLSLYDSRDGFDNLLSIYPRAHDYYKKLRTILAAGAEQDTDRKAWQKLALCPYQEAKEWLNDKFLAQQVVRHMFDHPALKRIEKVAPWLVVNEQIALVESLPKDIQPVFAEQFIFEGSPFKTLDRECRAVASYYRDLITRKFHIQPTLNSVPEPNPGIGK